MTVAFGSGEVNEVIGVGVRSRRHRKSKSLVVEVSVCVIGEPSSVVFVMPEDKVTGESGEVEFRVNSAAKSMCLLSRLGINIADGGGNEKVKRSSGNVGWVGNAKRVK